MAQTLSVAPRTLSTTSTFGEAKRLPKVALFVPRRETGRALVPERSFDAPATEERVSSHSAARALRVSDAVLEPLLADARERHASYGSAGIPFVSLAVLVLLIILA